MKRFLLRPAGIFASAFTGILSILILFASIRLQGAAANDTAVQLPATPAELDAAIARIESRLAEARIQSNMAQTNAVSGEPIERERLSRQFLTALNTQARSLERLKEIRKLNQGRVKEAESWRGFAVQPPYPITMVEQLRNEVASQRSEAQTMPMLVAIYERTLARLAKSLDESQRELRLAANEAENSTSQDLSAHERLQLAELRVRTQETMIETADLERLVAIESLAGRRDYIEFLDRKLATAEANSRFSQKDLDEILIRVKKTSESLQAELNQAIASDTVSRQELDIARTNLRQAELEPANSPDRAGRLAELRSSLTAVQAEADTSEIKIDVLRGFFLLANFTQSVWEDRYWATGERSLAELRVKQRHYSHEIADWQQWKTLLENRLASAVSESLLYAVQAADAKPSPVERQMIQKARAAVDARSAQYQRALVGLALAGAVAQRLNAELEARISHATFGGKLKNGMDAVGSLLRRLWRTELYIAEDSTIANGQKISIPRSITLGMVVIALAIFIAGMIAARQASHGIAGLVSRWLKAEQQTTDLLAQTTGVGIAIAALLVAMASVRIPWTVFAFVGGALAICIGFGAQTLVNNFISGLILLFERSIRVGDIVEVNDQRGKIVRIGPRNSIIKRGDSVDVLVPNSQFLEKTVVNWTLTDDLVRYKVTVGAAYGSQPAEVTRLIAQAASEHPRVVNEPAARVLFDDFGDNALVFTLEFWIRLQPQGDGGAVRSELRHRIYALLTQAGIVLAFPQRDVHLDSARPLDVRLVGTGQLFAAPLKDAATSRAFPQSEEVR
jgi:small-conductance mechanosensitive channel